MDKANSRFRVGLMVVMMIFCAVGSIYSIRKGKEAAVSHTDSLHKQNKQRYHK